MLRTLAPSPPCQAAAVSIDLAPQSSASVDEAEAVTMAGTLFFAAIAKNAAREAKLLVPL